jgi:hypothetical protein
MLGRRQILSSVLLSLSLSATLVGCGPGNEAKVASVKPGSLPDGGEWNGVYFSPRFGYLHLVSDNRSANGAWRTTVHAPRDDLKVDCRAEGQQPPTGPLALLVRPCETRAVTVNGRGAAARLAGDWRRIDLEL